MKTRASKPKPRAGNSDDGTARTDRVIREAECATLTELGRTTRWEMERRGEFPRRRLIGKNAVGWLESELLDWLRSRVQGGGRVPHEAIRQAAAVRAQKRAAKLAAKRGTTTAPAA